MRTLLLLSLLLFQQGRTVPSENGVVEGVVTTAAGRPAAGVRVTAIVPPSAEADFAGPATMASIAQTDAEGRFRLERIPPGPYFISAGRVDTPTYFPGTTAMLEAKVLTIVPGAVLSNVSFVLNDRSAGRATGTGPAVFVRAAAVNQPQLGDGPVGLTIPLTIGVEGGGKVPIFGSNYYPMLTLTRLSDGRSTDVSLSAKSLLLRVPPGVDEYKVSVLGLPEGFAVKTISYGLFDLQRDNLRFLRRGLTIVPSTSGTGEVARASQTMVITLTNTPIPAPAGVRVSGGFVGMGDEIYLSGRPGLLYADGSFEFSGVSPGIHTILRISGTLKQAATILVRDQNIDGVTLQVTPLLPIDLFSGEPKPVEGSETPSLPLASVVGQVIDPSSQQSLSQGTVTLSGHRGDSRTFPIVTGKGFRIPSLLPGQYVMTAEAPGYRTEIDSITVGFKDLELSISMIPAAQ